MKISVVIPIYNEKDTIEEIIGRVKQTGLADQIILVDDGSTDGTREIIGKMKDDPQMTVVLHEKNQGKGAALITGFRHASGDVILIQDADLEYNPKDYPELLRPIQENLADVVYGSRFLGAPRRSTMFWHMIANKLLTFATNILYNSILTDMETGYKVFRREIVKDMTIHSRRFDFEPEFTAKILKKKVRVFEVPITFNPRDYQEGKKIGLKDAFAALWSLLKYRFVD